MGGSRIQGSGSMYDTPYVEGQSSHMSVRSDKNLFVDANENTLKGNSTIKRLGSQHNSLI